ncbi:16S rRNA (guanine(527)-N(7))-methyltransferase RsmG [Lignipirellula cremea]|uniref:Ribosomal RNA small subunit methyltransferase G n=1 Tax=Lignipirellula cremea TaxID=2528010 RepID=A0A518DS11_9BACT|nr:16S rRNA (guanine(527)-N(7))-methyltransferase RsmG [Lignipirellula cremea]QDU94621.1 Ribosomal RNA small subunit methyltransferase G [Lignipirellula cremea]
MTNDSSATPPPGDDLPVDPASAADCKGDAELSNPLAGENVEDPSPTLEAALERYQLETPPEAIEPLKAYCALLWEWNLKLNLTRHTDYDKFVSRDLLDVLQLASVLNEGEEVLDVGSGGGVPGIPLAIVRPDLRVSLCESIGKKAKVLGEMTNALEIQVPVFHGRAEVVLDDFSFDSLAARAVGPLWKMLHWFQGRWHTIGRLLAIKGPSWPEERGEARHRGYMHEVDLRKLVEYPRPGADGQSVILQLTQKGR